MLRLWRSDAMLKHSDVARFTRSDAMFANKRGPRKVLRSKLFGGRRNK